MVKLEDLLGCCCFSCCNVVVVVDRYLEVDDSTYFILFQ